MFPQIPADLSALTPEELAALAAECRTAYAAARAEASTPEAVQALQEFATGFATVTAEITAREAAGTDPAIADQLAALDAQFSTVPPEGEEGDGAGGAGNGDGAAGEGDGGEGEGEGEGADSSLSADQIATLVDSAVSAALATRLSARTRPRASAPVVASIAELAARVGQDQAPLARPALAPFTITAAADVPGHSTGSSLSQRQLAEAFIAREHALGGGRGGPDDKVPVATFNIQRPENRQLSPEDYAWANDAKIRAFAQEREEVILAGGGLCAPVDNRYEQMVISESWRPVMGGAIPLFTSARGGLKQVPPPSLGDITSGVGTITAAADLAGATGAVKACFVVTCATATEDVIEADYVCVQFGNFGARTFPEQVEAWMQLAAAAHARSAEGNRLTDVKTKSQAATAAGLVGAFRELLSRAEQAQQVINSAARRPADAPCEVILPQWSFALGRADITRSLVDEMDLLGITNEEIGALFAARHLMVTLTPDSATGNGQVIAQEAGGVLNEYPSTVVADVFVPGTFLGIDSGVLNLGLVRDSALTMGSGGTAGNQFRMFYENFEALTKVGPVGSAIELTMTLCADGTYGAAKAVTCPIVT